MVDLYKKQTDRKNDVKIILYLVVAFLFVAWLCTPPGNKFAQMCFFGNHTQYMLAKIFNPNETTEYIYHRNNVPYMLDMDDKKSAIEEMDKAINTVPTYVSDDVLYRLYRDRGLVKIYLGEYKGALSDYLKIENPTPEDIFKIALLLKKRGLYRDAMNYCAKLVDLDANSYIGFACIADIYAAAGKPASSVKAFDLLIDRGPKRPVYYVERANYKKMLGDTLGYDEDIKKAQELSPNIDVKYSITQETLYPKKIKLEKYR